MVVFFFHFICSPPTGISLIHLSTSEEAEGPAPLVEDRIIPDFVAPSVLSLLTFFLSGFPNHPSNQALLPVVVEVVVSHLCFGWSLILCLSDWRAALVPSAGWFGYTEDVTDGGAVPPVQLPANIFPNYGEVEEDDPYRYYQPNYPAPRPVAPDDPALSPDDTDAYRGVRSVEGRRGA